MTIITKAFFIVVILAAASFAALWSLATFVEPDQHETGINIPQSNFVK